MTHDPLSAVVLERSGLSALGARQVLNAQVVASPEDRRRLVQVLARLCGAGSALDQSRSSTIDKDEKITIHMNRTELVQEFGLSAGGAQQVATGMPVTGASDRNQLVAALLSRLRQQGAAYILPYIEQENLYK